ncbi:MAG TPA: asparagine synthase (glutamine-hydrolyzing) [Chitinophagaceae bacterium]|nr:asparagine synthase (glutamine-hydrolyzing) [Chitinophagaceae bacterium]
MCRLAAIISSENVLLEQKIKRMTDAMHRGGPDDEGHFIDATGTVALGHRRLSILDTSSAGHQPMFSDNGNLAVVFNGEIYNYPALKEALQNIGYQFKSGSDTEVLLHGYKAWGVNLVEKLEGMFAFVLYDIEQQQVFAARDHAGIKPLYFGKYGGDFYFSSEVKGFTAVQPDWPPNLHWRVYFLAYGFLPEPITTLQNVQNLPKGNYMLYDVATHSYHVTPYFKTDLTVNEQYKKITYNEAVTITKAKVEAAVKSHLLSDVPVGVFLSGGVDSSIIATLAQRFSDTTITTLSIYFDDEKYSEHAYQNAVAEATGVQHHTFLVSEAEFMQQWPEIAASMDQPSTDAINTHFICKYAKQLGLKVVLSGLGGDELFGGYPSFQRSRKFNLVKKIVQLSGTLPALALDYPYKKIGFLHQKLNNAEYLYYRGLFTPTDIAKILHAKENDVVTVLNQIPAINVVNTAPANRAFLYETGIYMQSQLLKDSDVQSMWHSLELRVPLLDKSLLEWVMGLPLRVKYPINRHKPLLIDAFKSELPEIVWNRKKQGFTFPFERWFSKIEVFKNNHYVPKFFHQKFEKGRLAYARLWGAYLARTYGAFADQALNQSAYYQPNGNLFLYLAGFSKMGGIEKVNKAILKSLYPASGSGWEAWSVYDSFIDARYFPRYAIRGFSASRVKFLWHFVQANHWKHILVGHINLAAAIWLINLRKSDTRITLMAHGIEVWSKQKGFKKWLLQRADKIIAVSNYTKSQLVTVNGVAPEKIEVLHNCLDPFFHTYYSSTSTKPKYLLKRYHIQPNEKIILTLARLSYGEKYKGYDQVVRALALLKAEQPALKFKYLLCGKYDEKEYARIFALAASLKVEAYIDIPGFIADDEVQDHYRMADVFIMPSQKEGFGIVFIEAAALGTPVIAGNSDGSVEALRGGELGQLVDTQSIEAIKEAIHDTLHLERGVLRQQNLVNSYFKYDIYQENFLRSIE